MHSSELASRRRHLQISQAELGARLGLSSNTIARWERGDRPISHAKLLQLALERLAQEIEEERRNEPNEATYKRNQQIARGLKS